MSISLERNVGSTSANYHAAPQNNRTTVVNANQKSSAKLNGFQRTVMVIVLLVSSIFVVPFAFQGFRNAWYQALNWEVKNPIAANESTPISQPNKTIVENKIESDLSSSVEANARWDNDKLKEVWLDTKKALKNGSYTSETGKKVELPRKGYKTWMTKDKGGINQIYLYKNASTVKPVKRIYSDTKVIVKNLDSLDAAAQEVAKGRKPVVLNFANFKKPGGGFEYGANAQEEDLCRRSELGQMMISQKHNKKVSSHYPIDDKLIYTPNLTVFREGRAKDFAFLDKPFQVSFLTSAAPDLVHDYKDEKLKFEKNGTVDYSNPKIKEYVRQMAITQLQAAYDNEHDSVILGAFGCGAFGNPPDAVAQIYKEVLDKYFKFAFRKVIFAILNDQHSIGTKAHSPKGNYQTFKSYFL